jgi:hypothetical protein
MYPLNPNQSANYKTSISDFFHNEGANNYFINSSCILARDQVISIGNSYFYADTSTLSGINLLAVVLMNVYVVGVIVHLELLDMIARKQFDVHIQLKKEENNSSFKLVEPEYLVHKLHLNKRSNSYRETVLEFDF